MILLDGKKVASEKKKSIAEEVTAFKEKHGRAPHLSVILVGDDPASQVYVRNKHKACEAVGMVSTVHRLSNKDGELGVMTLIAELNSDPEVDGILLQLPLPESYNSHALIQTIESSKDVDGLTTENIGLMWQGKARVYPCTPSGVIEILDFYNIPIRGRNVVVIGRSLIVGRPMAYLLDHRQATVTICHSKTKDLKFHTQKADIVVAAIGQAHHIGREYFKKDAVVIDVGIHRENEDGKSKLIGDVRFHELAGWASAATPVPGGVGPMTITMLLHNTLRLAELRLKNGF